MNKPESQIPEEMLSAFLDGEVTPQQELEISAALEQNAEMRALLSDLKQIRLEIQNLPKHSLSEDFASCVVQVCKKHESDQVIVASTSKRNTRHSPWLKTIVGITATAATILVALSVVGPGRSLFTTTTAVSDSGRDAELSVPMSAEANEIADASDLQSALPTGMQPLENDEAQGATGPSAGGLGGRGRVGGVSAPELYYADPSMEALSGAEKETQQNRPFDAVVKITLSSDQLASNDNRRIYRFGNSEGMREARSLGESALRRKDATKTGVEDDYGGVAIPEGAQLFFMDGTREEIAAVFGGLNTLPTSITLLDQNADSKSIGIPNIESPKESTEILGVDSRQAQSSLKSAPLTAAAEEQAAAGPFQKVPGKAQPAPPLRSTSGVRNERTFADADKAEELEELPRYRILLIVQPPSKTP